MRLNDKESKRNLDLKRDSLDRDNAAETKQVRAEISQIKSDYIKEHGVPKAKSKIRIDGIAW